MPFTVSHVAAVLPVVGRSQRLPAAALVIGSMTPDYPYFLTRGWSTGFSHSPLGLVTVDLAVGVVAFVVWRRWVQAPVRDVVPRWVGERLPPPAGLESRALPWATLAVLVGALTHVVWDSFTHAGRWGVDLVPWLQEPHAGRYGWVWAQDISSVLGLLVVVAWCADRVWRAVPEPSGLTSTGRDRAVAWVILGVPSLVGAAGGARRYAGSMTLELYGAITFAGMGLGLGLAGVCLLWWTRARRPVPVPSRRG